MKQFFSYSLFALALAASSLVNAEKADSLKPAEIDADSADYDDVQQVTNLIGNVIMTRGTLIMKANKAVVKRDAADYLYATLYSGPDGFATFRQKRDGGDLWINGQAERIEYNGKTEVVKLFSKAKLKQLEGQKPTNEMEGEFISYETQRDFFTVNNTASGVSKPGAGRIKIVIQPRIEPTKK
jgi:lipopolysaccharide export system protein LptA